MIESLRAANDLKEQVGFQAGFVAVNYVLSKDIADNSFFCQPPKSTKLLFEQNKRVV